MFRSIIPRLSLLVATGVTLPGLFGCLEHPLKPVDYDKAQQLDMTVDVEINKNVDILFVVDNSGSMGEEQATLSDNFGKFIEVLERPEVSADYRIGLTTTDSGNPACQGTSPEKGALRMSSCREREPEFRFAGTNPPTEKYQEACLDVCDLPSLDIQPTTTDLDSDPKPRPWLENIGGETNLPEGVSTVAALRCAGPQGINGCGMESHLESMWAALHEMDDEQSPSFGFLRDDALLSVIHVTDEADCSYNPQFGEVFDRTSGNRVFWSDPGALSPTSAVCWNAGVVCEGGPGQYDGCRSANKDVAGNVDVADDEAVLHPVSRYVDLLRTHEERTDREVLVSVIGGVPEGYGAGADLVYQDAADPAFQETFGIGPGCTSAGGQAVPPVRLREFAEAFQAPGETNMFSVCAAEYDVALEQIAERLVKRLKPACMDACVADQDPSTERLDPLCTLEEVVPLPDGGQESRPVAPCVLTCGGAPCDPAQVDQADGWSFPAPDVDACYRLATDGAQQTATELDDMDEQCVDRGLNLEFRLERRPGTRPVAGTRVEATCALSENRELDCPDM